MTTLTISKPAEPGIWTRIWRALRAVDEAVHHDPAEELHLRIERLEAQLNGLQSNAHADAEAEVQ